MIRVSRLENSAPLTSNVVENLQTCSMLELVETLTGKLSTFDLYLSGKPTNLQYILLNVEWV